MKIQKEASVFIFNEYHSNAIETSNLGKSVLRAFRIVLFLLLPALNIWAGNYLAALFCGVLAVGVWAWLTRPCPNPYDQIPDPSDLNEWF
jgi:hypothetical protein